MAFGQKAFGQKNSVKFFFGKVIQNQKMCEMNFRSNGAWSDNLSDEWCSAIKWRLAN
jgi:hypothetical protein